MKLDDWVARLVIGLCAAVLALTGWGARQVYADLRTHAFTLERLQSGAQALDRTVSQTVEQVERVFIRIDDHDRRLIRREANAFTAQDANELSGNVARLAMQTSALSKDLEATMQQIASMRKDVQQLREAMIRSEALGEN